MRHQCCSVACEAPHRGRLLQYPPPRLPMPGRRASVREAAELRRVVGPDMLAAAAG